ncbi:MAG: nicotinamide-nucleotide amidohydrolase family protein [Spirochaetia bacterium]
MCDQKTAAIISAGTELTEGITQDAHVRYIASELTSLGFAVRRGVQVPDDRALFRAELARAAADACLVIITGGLGPTSDDLTREIVAEAAGVPLDFHQEAWDALVTRFAGRPVSEANRKQALAPRGFSLVPNQNGTAPGFHGALGQSLVVALPGPPSELRPMFSAGVLPVIAERFGLSAGAEVLWGTALMVPESSLEEALRTGSAPGAPVRWGTRVDEDRIVFSLRGGLAEERAALFDSLTRRLGPVRIRGGETRPAQLLTEALLARNARIAVAESCTGGLIGKYITDLPGSSRVFWGGFLAYSNESKRQLLGVSEHELAENGAVSAQVVREMAQGAVKVSGAEAGLSVSGIAGPEGGTPDKPVGTIWIGVARKAGACDARMFRFSGSRDMIRRRSAVAGMLFAEACLRDRDFLDTGAKW